MMRTIRICNLYHQLSWSRRDREKEALVAGSH